MLQDVTFHAARTPASVTLKLLFIFCAVLCNGPFGLAPNYHVTFVSKLFILAIMKVLVH